MLTDHPTSATPVVPTTSRTSRSRGLPLAGLTLAASLVLTACGGDAEEPAGGDPTATDVASVDKSTDTPGEGSPSDRPSTSEASKETAETSESNDGEYVPASADGPAKNAPKPEVPEGMTNQTEEGVKAAVDYFWQAIWYLSVTGDPSNLNKVVTDSCAYCQEEVNYFTTIYREGSWYVTTPSTVTDSSASLNGSFSANAWVSLDAPATTMYYSDGSKAGSSSGTNGAGWEIQLKFADGHWVVAEATIIGGSGARSEGGASG
ncbi:DUF6318 family protein [Nesterenkonia halophila]|uniref:DUF6318 family protein n=1 Tax=Nesterenkonia halophila TaxID=302044 RepID=UPI00129112F1|nr:DUF6318 family protein [Nesterenkonia halophila]